MILEYVLGFAFGWMIFQALFMRDMVGGSYSRSLTSTFIPELLSMNLLMAGMVPTMMLLKMHLGGGSPASPVFWFVMSMALLCRRDPRLSDELVAGELSLETRHDDGAHNPRGCARPCDAGRDADSGARPTQHEDGRGANAAPVDTSDDAPVVRGACRRIGNCLAVRLDVAALRWAAWASRGLPTLQIPLGTQCWTCFGPVVHDGRDAGS